MTENQVKYASSPQQDESISIPVTEWKKPPPIIHVFFEDKVYTVDIEAYQTNLIGLPDGRVLQTDMWMESYPPKHGKLTIVENPDMSKVIQAMIVEK